MVPEKSAAAGRSDLATPARVLVVAAGRLRLIVVGLIWLLGQTSTIVVPVIVAAVLGAVAGPAVGWLHGHRIPRIGGAVLVLLGLVAIGALIVLLVFGGISAQSDDISAKLNQGLEKLRVWLADLGVDAAQQAKENVQIRRPRSGTPAGRNLERCQRVVFAGLLPGLCGLSTLFVLKDGPVMQRFIDRHMGVPQPVAHVVTTNVAKSLRSYSSACRSSPGFNAVVIGIAADGDRCAAGRDDRGRHVRGRVRAVRRRVGRRGFAVLIALGTVGTDAALVMVVVSLLANSVLQPMTSSDQGATVGLTRSSMLVVTTGAGALYGKVGLTLAAR